MMIGQPVQRRSSGFGASPFLLVVVILAGLCIIEALLAARFWIQLTTVNASEGLAALVLDVSRPLVAPFTDARTSVEGSVSSFERTTLLAAMVYLLGAAGLAVMTMVLGGVLAGTELLSTRRRRASTRSFAPEKSLISHASARMLSTTFLPLPPRHVSRALHMLRLDELHADLVVIPAEGGCIVAAFATTESPLAHWPVVGRLEALREKLELRRSLRAIERRFKRTEQSGLAA